MKDSFRSCLWCTSLAAGCAYREGVPFNPSLGSNDLDKMTPGPFILLVLSASDLGGCLASFKSRARCCSFGVFLTAGISGIVEATVGCAQVTWLRGAPYKLCTTFKLGINQNTLVSSKYRRGRMFLVCILWATPGLFFVLFFVSFFFLFFFSCTLL